MEFKVDIYEIQENGRCKADVSILDLNLFIGGFRVVPDPEVQTVIVHMPKGMGSDWKYKEIEWTHVCKIISAEYLKLPEIQEIMKCLSFSNIDSSVESHVQSKELKETEKQTEVYINLYNFDLNSGDCQASIILPKSKIRIEGFKVKNMPEGGISVYMPRMLGTTWRYDEITWKEVQQKIADQYRKERAYVNSSNLSVEKDIRKFNVDFHSYMEEYQYSLIITILTSGEEISGSFFIRGEQIRVNIPKENQNTIVGLGIAIKDLGKICKDALERGAVISDEEKKISVAVSECIGQTVSIMANFSLPESSYVWKNFFMKETEEGKIVVSAPSALKKRWMNKKYPWNVLCDMLKEEFHVYITKLRQENKTKEEGSVCVSDYKEDSDVVEEMNSVAIEISELFENRKKDLEVRNQMGRVYNAKKNAFAFVPHSILKLVAVPETWEKKNLTRRLVYAINDPQGGIGSFEIELLDWISKLKYVAKTMILDLVLSGYISPIGKKQVDTNKMSIIMERLYKYDLIESSRFVSVDDNGEELEEGKRSVYHVHTLGATGYSLLKEMGRHPERRNPFGILADGNTVKKQLSANQWLVYWLTHYSKSDILDFSINTIINLMGIKWNGAKVYASINLETVSLIAEPVRRYEDFEKDMGSVEVQEKLIRLIEMLDNPEHLYTSVREQIVYPTRPVISYICEDEEHMYEVAEYVKNVVNEYEQQEVWFTTDARMFNYDCQGKRFLELKNGRLEILNLEQKIGLKEMTMEERGNMLSDK